MAEISLSVYQNKLDRLLEQNHFNEVIAHCRHILVEYPKNLKAYNQMAQALFSASRWDESAELFRRLLGALPNDFVAHYHLGQIYQHLELYDDAIWHTERAYDQQPNNGDVINELRALYKEHRNIDAQRLQLTAGAVAQQHIHNSLFQQAVSVLDQTLARYPNRVDLKVLRIRALWQSEKHLDAAEGAIEVLEQLPYSLIANRILTDLWLMEQRPSDAQRYLSRIEDLDPYMAYRIATGEPPIESLITIEELDYDAISRHELSTANPDWLNTLDSVDVDVPATDDLDIPEEILSAVDEQVERSKKVTSDLENLLSDDWEEQVLDNSSEEDELDALFSDLSDDEDLFAEFDDDVDDIFADFEDNTGDDLDEIFSDVEEDISAESDLPSTDELNLPDGMHTDDLPDGLLDRISAMKGMSQNETMPAQNRPDIEEEDNSRPSTGLTGMLRQLEEDDDLSWLSDAQQGDFDEEQQAVGDATDSDWLEELESIENSPDAQRTSTGLTGMFDDEDDSDTDTLDNLLDDLDEQAEEPLNPDDPTAWMKASGIEFDADAEPENLFALDDEDSAFESADVNPMAWLDGDEPESQTAIDPTELDPMAWMNEETGDLDTPADTANTPNFFEEIGFDDDTGDLEPDDDWFGDDEMLDEMLSLEDSMDNTTNQLSEAERNASVEDFFDEMDQEFDVESREIPDNVIDSVDDTDAPNFFDFTDEEEGEADSDQPVTHTEDSWTASDDQLDDFFGDDDDDDITNTEDSWTASDDQPDDFFGDDDDDITNTEDSWTASDDQLDDFFGDDDDDITNTEDSWTASNDQLDDFFGDDDDDDITNTEDSWTASDDQLDDFFGDDGDDDITNTEDSWTANDDQPDDDDDIAEQPEQPDWLAEAAVANASIAATETLDDDDSADDMMNLFDNGDDSSLPTDQWVGDDDMFSDDMMNLFDDDDDSSLPTDQWVGDDDMLDEMLSFEDNDLQFDADDSVDNTPDASESGDWQDNMNDDFNNDSQPEHDDELDPLAWLNDDSGVDSSASAIPNDNEEVDLEDMFAQLDDDDFDGGNAGLEWLETDEHDIVSDDEPTVLDDADPLGWLSDEGIEVAEDISSSVDEDLIIDDEDNEDTGSWLDRIDLSESLPAAEDESVSTEPEADWLADIEDEDFATTTDNNELNWLADDAADATPATDTDNFFNFEDTDDNSQFDFSSTPAATESDDEPDWLSALDNASDEFTGEDELSASDDEAEEADWLSNMGSFSDDDEAIADDQPDWLADVSVEDEEIDESPAVVEETDDWLSELGELEGDDDFDLDIMDEDDDIAEQPEQPDWLAGATVAGASVAAGMAANEILGDDDDETAEEGTDDWLAEIGEFGDDDEDEFEAVAEDDSDWLAEATNFEEDDEEFAGQAVDDNEPDWLTSADTFEESDNEEIEPAVTDDQPDWLSDAGSFEEDVAQQPEQPDWLASADTFEDDGEDEFEAVAEDDSDWLAEATNFEEDDIATVAQSVTQELDWIDEDDTPAEETAIGATADVDYLDEVDPATAPSALDWMTDVDAEDEVLFDEPIADQPQGITDFLNNGDDDNEEVAAVTGDDNEDWLAEAANFEDDDEEVAVAEEEPDWLAAANDFEEDEAEQPEQPDWLTGATVAGAGVAAGIAANEMFDDDSSDDMLDFEDDGEDFAISEDEPDWLAADDFGADEDIIEDEEADWLSTDDEFVASAIPDDGYDYENDDTIVGRPDLEKPDWLDGMEDGDGVQDAFGEDTADEIDWSDDTQIEEDLVAETPDWLDGMEEGDGIQDVFGEDTEDEFDYEFAENSGADDNIDAINDYETEAEPVVTYEEDDALPEFSADELFGDEAYTEDFEEETEFTPAEAAPDWLNAMVPGLDIDYDAEEDEPVDQGFVGETQPAASTQKGFDWLTDIVDEETGAMPPVVPKPQPPAAPRFTFSNPPAWLSKLFGGGASAASVATVADDTFSDNDDYDDLPDWLEVDDD